MNPGSILEEQTWGCLPEFLHLHAPDRKMSTLSDASKPSREALLFVRNSVIRFRSALYKLLPVCHRPAFLSRGRPDSAAHNFRPQPHTHTAWAYPSSQSSDSEAFTSIAAGLWEMAGVRQDHEGRSSWWNLQPYKKRVFSCMHQGHVKTQGEGDFFLLGLPSLWDHEKQFPLWSSCRVHGLCSSNTQSLTPRMPSLPPFSASGTHFPLLAVQIWAGSRSPHLPQFLMQKLRLFQRLHFLPSLPSNPQLLRTETTSHQK